jgi:DNA-binding protein HU-beta
MYLSIHSYLTKEGRTRMTKADLVAAVAETGVSKKEAAAALDSMIDAITGALKKGDKVSLVGFGSFSVKKRKARTGRNPQTGAAIKIPAKKIPAFSAGKALKDAVS